MENSRHSTDVLPPRFGTPQTRRRQSEYGEGGSTRGTHTRHTRRRGSPRTWGRPVFGPRAEGDTGKTGVSPWKYRKINVVYSYFTNNLITFNKPKIILQNYPLYTKTSSFCILSYFYVPCHFGEREWVQEVGGSRRVRTFVSTLSIGESK